MDAGLIGAAQRVEHYEIAAYGTARSFAELLGEQEHVSLLQETLDEEKETDQKLTTLSEDINLEATGDEEGEDKESLELGEDAEAESGSRKSAQSGRRKLKRAS
jgi:Domain of unknown function (DUF892)